MLPYHKKICCALGALLIVGCTKPQDQTWDALVLGLPDHVHPDINLLNMGHYILIQTHEPLLRQDESHRYYSNVLRRWERSSDETRYVFCPDEQVRFTAQANFTPLHLSQHLQQLTQSRNLPGAIAITQEQCVEVRFPQPVPHFLSMLTSHEHAPTLASADSRIHFGLGPFEVTSMTRDEISLRRKQPIRNGFNQIRFLDYKGRQDPHLNDQVIEDFNRVYVSDLPAWVKSTYTPHDATILQTVNLVINHPSRSIRRLVYDCLNIQEFRKAFMPGQDSFFDIATILPVGIAGAQEGMPSQVCDKRLQPAKASDLVFFNWKTDNLAELQRFFKSLAEFTNLHVTAQAIEPVDFLNIVLSRPHPYHLTVVALDAPQPNYDTFYDFILQKGSVTDVDLSPARALYAQLKASASAAEQVAIIDKLNAQLRAEAIILPLYQEVRPFYYPKRLRGMVIGRDYLEYPRVGELRL